MHTVPIMEYDSNPSQACYYIFYLMNTLTIVTIPRLLCACWNHIMEDKRPPSAENFLIHGKDVVEEHHRQLGLMELKTLLWSRDVDAYKRDVALRVRGSDPIPFLWLFAFLTSILICVCSPLGVNFVYLWASVRRPCRLVKDLRDRVPAQAVELAGWVG